jgi:hypothetical protein
MLPLIQMLITCATTACLTLNGKAGNEIEYKKKLAVLLTTTTTVQKT